MLLRLNSFSLLAVCGALAFGSTALAAPSAAQVSVSSPASSPVHPGTAPATKPATTLASLPDYGGRDGVSSAVAATGAGTAVNPLGQAWRAFEALVIVLALVVGGLYLLKRSGVIKGDMTQTPVFPKPAALSFGNLLAGVKPRKFAPQPETVPQADWITLVGSQPLPNVPGASLHLVTLAGKTLLIGATAQSLSLLTELDAEWETDAEEVSAPSTKFDAYLTHAEDASGHMPSESDLLLHSTTMRLRAMIARSQAETNGRAH